jgi:hypothetical protein
VPWLRSVVTLAAPPAAFGFAPRTGAASDPVLSGASRADGPLPDATHPVAWPRPADAFRLPLLDRRATGSARLEYVRASVPGAAALPDAESIRRQVEERVERTLVERMERLVARELSADSAPLSRISERVTAELSEALVLERERLGWS